MLDSTTTSPSLASRRSPADLVRPFCSLASTSLCSSHGAGYVMVCWEPATIVTWAQALTRLGLNLGAGTGSGAGSLGRFTHGSGSGTGSGGATDLPSSGTDSSDEGDGTAPAMMP